jgi:hypothetical protein
MREEASRFAALQEQEEHSKLITKKKLQTFSVNFD